MRVVLRGDQNWSPIPCLGHGRPRLVILHMAVVGMVRAVADAPAVVGHEDRGVHDVADEVVDGAAVAEAIMTTVCE